ncbi:universal stress protein [Hymenobacter koreensis]|uniref:UspA domain-containing protein n=1 Tax=Hymenobacter koreensis TaxID=1084523 RepID=A0ABP8J6E5_9BACT
MALSLLVLTDFFQAANRALDYATSLAAPLGARLVLLHVRGSAGPAADALTNLSPDAVGLALNCLADELPVPVVAEVGRGPLPPVVADALRRHHPALVVLGRSDAAEASVADTALALLRESPYPLLMVPGNAPATPPQRILLAIDGEPFTLGAHAGTARRLLNSLHAQLTLLHCTLVPASEEALAAAEDSVLRTGLMIDLPPVRSRSVVAPHPAAAILAAAQPTEFDAVVLVARRRSFWGQLFHRSVTAQVLQRCPLPVLVLPASE